MARVYKRQDYYWIDFTTPDGRRIRRSLRTKNRALASKVLKETQRRVLRGSLAIGEKDKDCDVSSFIGRYFDHPDVQSLAPSTRDLNRIKIHQFFSFVGKQRMSRVSREDILRYKQHRMKQVSPVTVNGDLRVIRAVFNFAVKNGLLSESPFKDIAFLKLEKNYPRFLEKEEIEKILKSARKFGVLSLFAAGIYAGLRKNELSWLEWEDIDFERNTITIKNKDGFRPKNWEARTIPLNSKLKEILRRGLCTPTPAHVCLQTTLWE